MIAKSARLAGWLLVFAVAVLTLAPKQLRPQLGIEHHLEHFLAFAFLGLLFGIGYPRCRLAMALLGIAATAGLETMQMWAPGRHAVFGDFFMNALGVCVGLAAASLLDAARRRVQVGPSSDLLR